MNFEDISINTLAKNYGTPTYFYSKSVIETRIQELKTLGIVRYAQKALPNISILALMKRHEVVVDAVSAGELFRALHTGYKGTGSPPGIVYTADILDEDAIPLIKDFRIPINAGSADMLRQAHEFGLDVPFILRLNPGFGHGHSRKTNTGGCLSKHGIWHSELPAVLEEMKQLGLRLHGLHMHIGSGTDLTHLQKVAESMLAAFQTCHAAGVDLANFQTISAGGGLPVPYRGDEERIDLSAYRGVWTPVLTQINRQLEKAVTFEIEPGRYLVAESGIIVTKIRAKKFMDENLFYLLDAGFDTLARPAMYGSYHELTMVPAPGSTLGSPRPSIVAGPLCESGDVFTQAEGGLVVTRDLPEAQVGDYVVIHTTGAYGAAMASQYNSRLLAAEVLVTNGEAQIIRKRQELEEVIAREILL